MICVSYTLVGFLSVKDLLRPHGREELQRSQGSPTRDSYDSQMVSRDYDSIALKK